MNTYIHNLTGLASCLTTHGYADRYPRTRKVVFDNGPEFKRDFDPLLKDFDIKPVLTSVKNPQSNAPFERVHKIILNMPVTKDLDNKVFDYTDPWGENLVSIAWEIRSSYHITIMDTPGQSVFDRDILFNLASFVDWQVVPAAKQRPVDIDNIRENAKRVMHDYAIDNQVYVKMVGIYRKLDYRKQGTYIITDVFTNGTV